MCGGETGGQQPLILRVGLILLWVEAPPPVGPVGLLRRRIASLRPADWEGREPNEDGLTNNEK